jgi:hypothetical protein
MEHNPISSIVDVACIGWLCTAQIAFESKLRYLQGCGDSIVETWPLQKVPLVSRIQVDTYGLPIHVVTLLIILINDIALLTDLRNLKSFCRQSFLSA